MANYTVDIQLALKAQAAEKKLKNIQSLVDKIDNRAASISDRFSKLLIPDKTFARIASKLRNIEGLQKRSLDIVDKRTKRLEQEGRLGTKANSTARQRAQRLQQETGLLAGLKKIEKARQDILETTRINSAQRLGDLRAQTREVEAQARLRKMMEEGAKVRASYRADAQRSALSSPIGGRVDIPGSPAAVRRNAPRSPIGGSVNIPGSPAARKLALKPQAAEAARARRGFQSAALGAGFPLLFGGGAGSIAGGLAGSAFGFGGQILGSALGQQLDKLAAFALKAGAALNDPINGFEELIALSREYGREVKGQQKLLIALGLSEVAAVQAAETFEAAYGTKTVRDLKNLKDVTEAFQDGLTRLGVAMAALLSGPVGSALQALTVFLPASRLDKNQENIARLKGERRTLQEQAAEQLKFREGHSQAGSRAQAKIKREEQEKFSNRIARKTEEINKLEKERKQIIQEQNSFLNSQSKQVELIESQLKAIAEIDERRTKQEQMRLTARRDAFASYSAKTEIKDAQRELDIVNKNLKAQQKLDAKQTVIGAQTDSTAFLNALAGGEKSAETKQLEQEQLAAQQKLNRARFKGANNVLTVERVLKKEQLASSVSRIRLLNQRQELSLKLEQGEKGRFALYEKEQMQLSKTLDVNIGILDLQEASALIGVVEEEKRTAITRQYGLQRELAKDLYYRQAQSLEQAEAAYRLSILRVQQEEKLKDLKAKLSAEEQIQQTSPFASQQFISDPFFGDSNQLQAQQALSYANNLKLLGAELSHVNEQLNIFALAPSVREGLEQQETKLQNQIARYKEYQPAIDEAALAQARFNDALAITTPLTDSLFDSLVAVVEGTKTAEQAFADFLRNIGDMLIQAAAQMIAQYIALGIAKAFAFGGSTGPDFSQFGTNTTGVSTNFIGSGLTGFAGYAEGGYVTGPTNAVVGEGGEPEYVIPSSKMNEAMGRYARGIRGGAVIPDSSGGDAGGEMGSGGSIDVTYSVERINSVDYVTAAEFERGIAQAAKRGAEMGKRGVYSDLVNKRSIRSRVGI